jgi:hypothetical protein
MGFKFLKNISKNSLKQWNRGDLVNKLVVMAKELIVSKEKVIQQEKKILSLENDNRRLKAEKAKPEFKAKNKITNRGTSEVEKRSERKTPPSKKKV